MIKQDGLLNVSKAADVIPAPTRFTANNNARNFGADIFPCITCGHQRDFFATVVAANTYRESFGARNASQASQYRFWAQETGDPVVVFDGRGANGANLGTGCVYE